MNEVPPINCRHCGKVWGPDDRHAIAETPQGKFDVCVDSIDGQPSCFAGLVLQVYGEKLGERKNPHDA